jgi:UDP-N-acetylmuramate dehydrogenase
MSLDQSIKEDLAKRFAGKIRFDEPMAAHTSLRVGGPADAMVWPDSKDDVKDLLNVLLATGTPWSVFGGGTNLLVRDGGIRGVVICTSPGLSGIRLLPEKDERTGIKVLSGTSLWELCRFAADRGLSGLAFAAGIPGTVGGAALMNAGIPDGDMSGVLSAVEMAVSSGKIIDIGRSEMTFAYRSVKMPENAAGTPGRPGILLSASLALEPGNRHEIHEKISQLLQKRKQAQPGGFSAGSFFKNPTYGPTAGELIDQAGLKGKAVGDGVVSEKHANWILNRKNASAGDILALMGIIQNRVREAFGVNLEPEVKIIGE